MVSEVPEELFFDLVRPDEVAGVYEIEKAAFQPEEAASLETLKTRQSVAQNLFLGVYKSTSPRTLIGYADATLAKSSTLTAESMHVHDPDGTSACIHGLAVVESYRRTGIATRLLKEYIHRLRHDTTDGSIHVQRVLLICHEDLIPLYTKIGFDLLGKSPVVHGPDAWYEMRIELGPAAPQELPQAQDAVPPDVLAALTNASPNRPVCRLYSSFPSSQSLVAASGENAFDILCPRTGCGSIILKAGAATFQRRESIELEPPSHTPPEPLARLPPPPAEIDWWLVTPSPMTFENIAFSRPVPSSLPDSSSAPQLKFLACAECDLGAFGWSKAGGHEFWLAVSRVGYR